MNKMTKIALAILGGTNAVVGMFIPVAVSLMVVTLYSLTPFSEAVVIGAGILSALYRAIIIAVD